MRHCCFFMGLVDKKILITFLLIVQLYQCYKLWPVVVTEWHQKKFDIFSFVSGFWFKFKAAFVALKPSIRALWFQSDPLPQSSQEADLLYNKLLMHLLHSAAPVFTRALSSSLFFFFFFQLCAPLSPSWAPAVSPPPPPPPHRTRLLSFIVWTGMDKPSTGLLVVLKRNRVKKWNTPFKEQTIPSSTLAPR